MPIVPKLGGFILLQEKALHERSYFFYRGYLQGFFIALLVLYVWFFPVHSFLRGRLDAFADIVGIGRFVIGTLVFGRLATRADTHVHELSKPQHSLPQGHTLVYGIRSIWPTFLLGLA